MKLKSPYEDPFRPWDRIFQEKSLKAFVHLLRKPYWQRMWIIQELAMGDYSTPILSGGQRVLWGQLLDVAKLFSTIHVNIGDDMKKQLGFQLSSELSDRLWRISQLQKVQQDFNEIPSIGSNFIDRTMRLSQSAMATDPKDKIYGQLGLLPKEVSALIVPDYTLDVRKVYVKFAKSVIQATKSLKIILLGNRNGRKETWPSWVLDMRLAFDTDDVLLGFEEPYRASGNTSARVILSGGFDDTIICGGFKIAKAVSTDERSPSNTKGGLALSVRKRDNNSEIETAAMRLMNGDAAKSMEALLTARPFSTSSHRESEKTIIQSMHLLEQIGLATGVLSSRQQIGFTEGHLIFSAHSVKTGDDICILFGCSYPVILRQEDSKYIVIGECYIYDLRDGETIEWLNSGKFKEEFFTLK